MFRVEGDAISFGNGRRHTLGNLIAEYIEFEESVVVRLGNEPLHRTNENIFSFDYAGKLLWQVPSRPHLASQSPYVSMSRRGVHLEVINWDGYMLTIHPKSGIVIQEGYYSAGGGHGRQPSKRRWV